MENGKLGVVFEGQSVIDKSRVFYLEGNVYRSVEDQEDASLYASILQDGTLRNAFALGLVPTEISDIKPIETSLLVLKHEKIDFFLHPSEMSDMMFWQAALTFLSISKDLAKHGLVLRDSHPWNMTFHNGRPMFFDFGSIGQSSFYSMSWLMEFYIYFAVPIRLASSKTLSKLSLEYRRQHLRGFGIGLASNQMVRRTMFWSFWKIARLKESPIPFLSRLEDWVKSHRPLSNNAGKWASYEQAHEASFEGPKTIKQQFVYDILNARKPSTVVDLATNKGYYALMAQHLGANVMAFDYEPHVVDEAIKLAKGKRITFGVIDFTTPTPAYGWGLTGPDAFKRFRCEVGLALGLIHHVCITQRFPVELFCEVCAKYSKKGVVLEFVYPEDIHVASWNTSIPLNYNIRFIKQCFKKYYEGCVDSPLMTENNTKRQFFFFYAD